MFDNLIPAAQRGDYAAANRLVNGPLRSDYNLHRAAIDQVVKTANIRNARVEREVGATVRNTLPRKRERVREGESRSTHQSHAKSLQFKF